MSREISEQTLWPHLCFNSFNLFKDSPEKIPCGQIDSYDCLKAVTLASTAALYYVGPRFHNSIKSSDENSGQYSYLSVTATRMHSRMEGYV